MFFKDMQAHSLFPQLRQTDIENIYATEEITCEFGGIDKIMKLHLYYR